MGVGNSDSLPCTVPSEENFGSDRGCALEEREGGLEVDASSRAPRAESSGRKSCWRTVADFAIWTTSRAGLAVAGLVFGLSGPLLLFKLNESCTGLFGPNQKMGITSSPPALCAFCGLGAEINTQMAPIFKSSGSVSIFVL